MNNIKELKKEADLLGIKYANNSTIAVLEQKIKEAKDNLTVEKAEKVRKLSERELMAKKKKEAMELVFVSINSNNPLESEDETVFVNFGNKYYELGRLIPLNTDVWVEKALVSVLATTKMTAHINETDRLGKPTGNKVPKQVNKYNISYPKGPITFSEFKKQEKLNK